MPLTDSPSPFEVSFDTSVAAELLFLLRSLGEGGHGPHAERIPVALASSPELVAEAAGLWPEPLPAWELLVLAHEAGSLTGLLDVGQLERACMTVPLDLPLRSEPARDREVVLERLGRLRHDEALRRHYLAVVGSVWSAVAGQWEETLPTLTATLAECRRRAGRGETWQEALKGVDFSRPTLQAGFERARNEGSALVAVCSYGGSLTLDLPGVQFFAFSVRPAAVFDRAAHEVLARRLRALADPTRLALCHLLAEGPRQVGEIAHELGISQPTVSNHVKVLREAGLLSGRSGERRSIVLDGDAISELLEEAARGLVIRRP